MGKKGIGKTAQEFLRRQAPRLGAFLPLRVNFRHAAMRPWSQIPCVYERNGIASLNFFGGGKIFDFRLAAVFCLRHHFPKHKITRYSKNLGHGPLVTAMYEWHINFTTLLFSHRYTRQSPTSLASEWLGTLKCSLNNADEERAELSSDAWYAFGCRKSIRFTDLFLFVPIKLLLTLPAETRSSVPSWKMFLRRQSPTSWKKQSVVTSFWRLGREWSLYRRHAKRAVAKGRCVRWPVSKPFDLSVAEPWQFITTGLYMLHSMSNGWRFFWFESNFIEFLQLYSRSW